MYVTTPDNTRLYVKDWGQGKPVILIHGWPLSADSWDPVAVALAKAGFRTIAYDRRGFGRSDQPWNGYDYDTLTDDLAAILQTCQATEATLVGFSMGGGEVARYMSRYQGKQVIKTVLVSSVVPYLLKTDNNPKGLDRQVFVDMKNGLQDDRPHFLADFFKDYYNTDFISKRVSTEYLDWSRQVAMQASLQATLACVDAFAQTDFRPDLPAFKIPTLIIHGTSDKIVPIEVSAYATARGIPHSLLLEYEDEPHGLLATRTNRLIEDLLAFLKS